MTSFVCRQIVKLNFIQMVSVYFANSFFTIAQKSDTEAKTSTILVKEKYFSKSEPIRKLLAVIERQNLKLFFSLLTVSE